MSSREPANGAGVRRTPGGRFVGTTEVSGELERVDQRHNAFWRHKHGLVEGAPDQPPPPAPQSPPSEGPREAGDPLQRIYFGDARRPNCLNEMLAAAVDGPCRPQQHRFASPEAAAKHVREIAAYMGADLVGFCRLDRDYVYSHVGHESGAAYERAGEPVELDHEYAIVMAFEMNYRLVSASPSYIDAAEVGRGYVRAGMTAIAVAAYIRELGWPARAHTVRNEQVLQVPLAVQAGLGELGRNGFLVTARYGPRVRLSSVTTTLPLAVDGPVDLGVAGFCSKCLKCSDCCPSQSIPGGGPEWVRGVHKWQINGDTCLGFWMSAPARWCNCNVCIKVCPWNKPDTWWHGLAAGAVRRLPWLARPLVWFDDAIYGRNPRPHVRFLEYDNRKPSPWV